MTSKKRRPTPAAAVRNSDPLVRLQRAQEAFSRAQVTYEKALQKRSDAIREAVEQHPVAEVAATLGISRSKVYEILSRGRAPRRTTAPQEPTLPL